MGTTVALNGTLSRPYPLKRTFDVVVAGCALAVTGPFMLVRAALALSGDSVLERRRRLGLLNQEFDELRFRRPENRFAAALDRFGCRALPVLLNVLRGDLSVVGPRAIRPHEMGPAGTLETRHRVKPGLRCLWWIRQRGNTDYGTEIESDLEYVAGNSLLGDIGILLRSCWALLFGNAECSAETVRILGVRIDNVTMVGAIERIERGLCEDRRTQVAFVNADCLNIAAKDFDYKRTLSDADLVLPDGIGLKLAGNILSRPIHQNVNGTDLFPCLCRALRRHRHTLFLLGAEPGVADRVRQHVAREFPGLRIVGTHHGFFGPSGDADVVRQIAASGADVLLVAMGVPGQDLWIRRHLVDTGVRLALGVGGLFVFIGGKIPRAPIWMRDAGLEWVYRLTQEPARMWKRYLLGNFLFLGRVLAERLTPIHDDAHTSPQQSRS